MPKYLYWTLILPAVLLFSGCEGADLVFNSVSLHGSGKVISENRSIRGIHEVELSGVGELSLHQGKEESLTVEAEDNLMPRIQTEVEGSRLKIGVERGFSLRPTTTIRYTLVVRDLTSLELSGSGKVISGALRCGDLAVHLPGSGDIQIDQLDADNLDVGISGSGDIRIPGRVNHQTVQISGSGDYDGKELDSQSTEVSISGSGDTTLWVRDSLTAHISGSGDIAYYGSAKVSKSISGSGEVRSMGERP